MRPSISSSIQFSTCVLGTWLTFALMNWCALSYQNVNHLYNRIIFILCRGWAFSPELVTNVKVRSLSSNSYLHLIACSDRYGRSDKAELYVRCPMCATESAICDVIRCSRCRYLSICVTANWESDTTVQSDITYQISSGSAQVIQLSIHQLVCMYIHVKANLAELWKSNIEWASVKYFHTSFYTSYTITLKGITGLHHR